MQLSIDDNLGGDKVHTLDLVYLICYLLHGNWCRVLSQHEKH